MNEINETVNEKSVDFKNGFEEGFHKGIVQGYIKGHTDATEEFNAQKEQSFVSRIIEMVIKLMKESVFINTPFSSLIGAIRSLFKALPQIFQLNLGALKLSQTAIPQTA